MSRPNYNNSRLIIINDSKSDSDDKSRATEGCMVSTDKGNNGTVSETMSEEKSRPRRVSGLASVIME